MPFKTKFNEDVLNEIFDYAGLKAKYNYYKQEKKSNTGFRDIKIHYKCECCGKTMRSLSNKNYGFLLYFYNFYLVNMTDYCVPKGLSRYYHPKKLKYNNNMDRHELLDSELDETLNNSLGDLIETNYHYILKIRNKMNGKILGKIVLKTLNYIETIYSGFNKYKRKMEKCGIDIKNIEIESQESILKSIKLSLINMNDNVKLGYYCSICLKKSNIYNFIKL
jgi:hypothetical protein